MSMNPRRTVVRSNTNAREFESFFEGWLVRQEHYLEELRSTLRSFNESKEDLRDLINRVLAHYQQYYEQKSRIANSDVFVVFSPPWFSPFERTFFWIAGFKPGLAFRVVGGSVEDMSEEQGQRMERLKAETEAEEKELGDELARIQESVASPAILPVARGGLAEEMESAVEILRAEMEVVLSNADMLRTRTAERVVEILTPAQNVKFWTAVTELQLKIRMWGSQLRR